MKKFNLLQKMNDHKKIRLEKKLQKIENKITFLKQVDGNLSNISLNHLPVREEPEQGLNQLEKRIYTIEKKLQKLKISYENKLKEGKLEIPNLQQIQIDFTTVKILDNALKMDTQNTSIEKEITSINKILSNLLANPKTKEYTISILDSIVSYLVNLPESMERVKLNSTDKLTQRPARKIEKHLLRIKRIYDDKVAEVYATKYAERFNTTYEKYVYKVKVRIARLTHQNKVLNDILWWLNLSNEEKKDRCSDLSFYVSDSMGYWLTLLSVVAEIVYLILLLSVMVRTYWLGITILVNIAFLLLLFTIAIKVKNYKRTFSYVSIAFGLYCILRISYVIHGLMGVDLSTISTVKLAFIYGANVYMILASIFTGVRSYFKIKHQMLYLNENKITKFQLSK